MSKLLEAEGPPGLDVPVLMHQHPQFTALIKDLETRISPDGISIEAAKSLKKVQFARGVSCALCRHARALTRTG